MRKQTIAVIVLLAIQFTLGMVLNFFVKIPDDHPGTVGAYFTDRLPHGFTWALTDGGGIWLALHVLVGTLLVAAAIFLIVAAHRRHEKKLVTYAWLGGIFILSAWINGNNFIELGQHDGNSLVMALSFLAALLSYEALLASLPKKMLP